jgi:hypothetical protein
MACFLLVTFLPLPLLSVPRLRSCITCATFFDADFEYFLAILPVKLLSTSEMGPATAVGNGAVVAT